MKNLFKRIRLELGLFTRNEMYNLAGKTIEEFKKDKNIVWQNATDDFIEDLKTNK
jgi:hypothetical protein